MFKLKYQVWFSDLHVLVCELIKGPRKKCISVLQTVKFANKQKKKEKMSFSMCVLAHLSHQPHKVSL